VSDDPPQTIEDAYSRYTHLMGDDFTFVTKDGWSDRITRAAIWTLLKNGFSRGKTLEIAGENLNWLTNNEQQLFFAAAIETEFGGNSRLADDADKMAQHVQIEGRGDRAVYVYTDSRLDSLGDTCTKIGRHDQSGVGEVIGRVISQYGTGNPGKPVLHYIFKTKDEVALETQLHRHFTNSHIDGGFGTEWFSVKPAEVRKAALENYIL
jgi:hypothetical protein